MFKFERISLLNLVIEKLLLRKLVVSHIIMSYDNLLFVLEIRQIFRSTLERKGRFILDVTS